MPSDLSKGRDPVTGWGFDLSKPKNLVMTVITAFIGITGLLLVLGAAWNEGLPRANGLLTNFAGIDASPPFSGSGGPNVEVH